MQSKPKDRQRTRTFSKSRLTTLDVGTLDVNRHNIHGMLEIDITRSRQAMRELRRSGTRVSLLGWIIKVIASTVSEFETVHGFYHGKRKITTFQDVDISVAIERQIDGEKIPIPVILKSCQNKSIFDISEQIENARTAPISQKIIIGEKRNRLGVKFYYALPGPLRRLILRAVRSNPAWAKKNMGSVLVSAVGMYGPANGWFLMPTIHPLTFSVGNIIKKPAVVKNKIVIRQFLHLTIIFDHDVIDGGTCARFAASFVKKLENSYEL